MPRTKKIVKHNSSADINMTSANATMANPTKNMKEILDEFNCESNMNATNY